LPADAEVRLFGRPEYLLDDTRTPCTAQAVTFDRDLIADASFDQVTFVHTILLSAVSGGIVSASAPRVIVLIADWRSGYYGILAVPAATAVEKP
jgi:hypothetical protein